MLCLDLAPNQRIIDLKATLNSGHEMPVITLGTYQITGRPQILETLDAAFKAGYRSIDTAAVYRNEQEIGYALRQLLPKHGLKREDIFITTKLAPSDHGDELRVTQAVTTSLQYLGISYIDLYLIHWPGAAGYSPSDPCNYTFRTNTWKHLIKLYNEGKGIIRSIGVSNFTVGHLSQLLRDTSIIPAVNQVEFHPHFQQSKELTNIAKKNGIILQAYSPLGGTANPCLLKDPIVSHVAHSNKITPGQTLLRYALQRGYAVVPKSVTPSRIEENSRLEKELSQEDINTLNNIGRRDKYAWNPEPVL